MFFRFAYPFLRKICTPRKLITATAMLGYTIFKTQKTLLDSLVLQESGNADDERPINIENLKEYIKTL